MSVLSGHMPGLPERELPQPAPRPPELRRDYVAPRETYRYVTRRTRFNEAEERLLARIANGYGLPVKAVLSRSRYPRIVRARRHFLAVLRWSTFMSFPDIGALMGMDHTSVIAAVNKYERELNS